MFGYIKPFVPMLRVCEHEAYKGVYCGLCRTLRKRYSAVASLLVNYDMVFAAMLLSEGKGAPTVCHGRCVASPFKKKCYIAELDSLDIVADATVIFAWHKLMDDLGDERGIRRLRARILRTVWRPLYKKAASYRPELAFETERYLALFSKLEKEGCASIDRMTDCMGHYAEAMAYEARVDRDAKRAILYYEMRLITLADALDDYEDDRKAGRYNLISARYGNMSDNTKVELRQLVTHTMNEQYRLMQLLTPNAFSSIVENILTRGADQVMNDLLAGKTRGKRGRKHA
ncbi:MAG: hypothetical protein IJF34_07050 [Clostridia bacterium]|nr:hypothetical protein [Clostridia bacterium]MBQ4623358.1 hypothetical protein [Clostridia bacterium]